MQRYSYQYYERNDSPMPLELRIPLLIEKISPILLRNLVATDEVLIDLQ